MPNREDFKLGKGIAQEDNKTLKLANFVNSSIQIPISYDFDKNRSKFPANTWGNLLYGDCVIAGRANQLVRLERAETKKNISLVDDQVVSKYKELTGCVSPGDDKDTGLIILQALKDWRTNGWTLPQGKSERKFSIDAFAKIDHSNHWLLRAAIYLFNGVQFGFALPVSAQSQTAKGYWDVVPGQGSEPNSWGGHCVSAFSYDADNIYVLTWGKKVKVSNAFVDKYADEAWSVIDSLDNWASTNYLNVPKLIDEANQLGIRLLS